MKYLSSLQLSGQRAFFSSLFSFCWTWSIVRWKLGHFLFFLEPIRFMKFRDSFFLWQCYLFVWSSLPGLFSLHNRYSAFFLSLYSFLSSEPFLFLSFVEFYDISISFFYISRFYDISISFFLFLIVIITIFILLSQKISSFKNFFVIKASLILSVWQITPISIKMPVKLEALIYCYAYYILRFYYSEYI